MITEQTKELLLSKGFSKQQVESLAVDKLINLLLNEDWELLIQEAKNRVAEEEKVVNALRKEYSQLHQEINAIGEIVLSIAKAQEEHGTITDEKAKNAIAMYASILAMNRGEGVKGVESVNNAGFVTYAYLGGQARRITTYEKPLSTQGDDD